MLYKEHQNIHNMDFRHLIVGTEQDTAAVMKIKAARLMHLMEFQDLLLGHVIVLETMQCEVDMAQLEYYLKRLN
tara:strand:- start:768 stop:989 length:222 start_codon:yes stop_codon:yes gene_type:complete